MSCYRELPPLLKLSWPLVLTQLAQVAIVFTDTVMMGILGEYALAGAGLGAALFSFLQVFTAGIITVVSNLVAYHWKEHEMVQKIVHAGLFIAAILSISFGCLLWYIKLVFILLGQEASVANTAELYLRALLWGMLPNLLFMTLRAFTIGVMQPGLITIITIIAIGLNIVLNLFFIMVFPELGVAGLGIASSLVFFSMFAAITLGVTRFTIFADYRIFKCFWSFNTEVVFKILRLGVPIGLIFTFEGGFFTLGVFLAGLLGTTSLAAHNIAVQWVFLTYMVAIGIASATSIIISQVFGERPLQLQRIRQISYTGLSIGTVWMLIPAVLFWLFPALFITLFTYFSRTDISTVFVLAAKLLMVAAVFQLFDGIQAIVIAILRALEESVKAMWAAVIGYWLIGAPMAYLIGFVWQGGIMGVWWGFVSGLASTALLGWLFFELKIRQLKKQI